MSLDPCRLEDRDGQMWCLDCQRFHLGHTVAIALDPSEKGMKYRAIWRRTAPIRSLLRSLPLAKQCRHNIGENGTTKAGCGACTTYACNLKGTVKLSACAYCTSYEMPTAVAIQNATTTHHENSAMTTGFSWQTRHLLFHLWPKKTSQGTWQRNLDQLKQRWPLFDGKRVIAVATSQDSHPMEAVQDYMHGYDCEWIHVENDPNLREVKTFLPLFEQVEGLPGYTFYAQGKGVTKPINPGISIHAWTSAMYETLLDYWPLVEDHLKRFPVVGSFKKAVDGAFGGSSSTWHYSGSFCWFNNEQLWKRNWRAIEQVWFGIESYPSMIFSKDEAGCIFYCQSHQFNLYKLSFWNKVEQELKQWRLDNAQHLTHKRVTT